MICIRSRSVEPWRQNDYQSSWVRIEKDVERTCNLSTASTARLAKYPLSCDRTLEERVVRAMLTKSSRNLVASVLNSRKADQSNILNADARSRLVE